MWDFPTISSISELPDKVHINVPELQIASESILLLHAVSYAHSFALYLPSYYILKEVWKEFKSTYSTSLSSSFLWTGSSKPHTSHWSQVWAVHRGGQVWGSGRHQPYEETMAGEEGTRATHRPESCSLRWRSMWLCSSSTGFREPWFSLMMVGTTPEIQG